MTREEIYEIIVDILKTTFEIDEAEIQPETHLYEDLDLDSIDAINMFVHLREHTGRRPAPEEARLVRTVEELVTFVEAEIAKGPQDDDDEVFDFAAATDPSDGEAGSP